MPIVFIRSSVSLAFEKALYSFVTLIVGMAFGYLFFSSLDIPTVVKIASALAVIIALFMLQKITRELMSILKNGEDWRVEISNNSLSWQSPIPEQMQSFILEFSEIKSVQHIYTRYRNSKRSPKKEFYIELQDGSRIDLKPQKCGINPIKVFAALEEKGIEFQSTKEIKGPRIKVGAGDVSIGLGNKD